MKKQVEIKPDLKKSFPPMPDDCYQALMHAARSVKEENPVKKTSLRAVLIAAVILILSMAAALAANQLGIIDIMPKFRAALPEAATALLAKTENKVYTLGPLTMTLRELLADGRVVLMTTQANTADGALALLMPDGIDFHDRLPESEARRLKVPEDTSFLDAARQNKLPLYSTTSYLEIDYALHSGEEMRAEHYGGDGALLQVEMLQTNPGLVKESVDAALTLTVREVDPASGEFVKDSDWRVEEKISIPVSQLIAEKTYVPDGEAILDGYSIKSVKAEQTVAGIYLTTLVEAGESTNRDNAHQVLYTWEFVAADKQPFPGGISMSGSVVDDAWPTVTLHQMIGVGNLPDILKLSGTEGTSPVTLK